MRADSFLVWQKVTIAAKSFAWQQMTVVAVAEEKGREGIMVSEKMTLSQLMDILSSLLKAFVMGEVKYDCVSGKTAEFLLMRDRKLFAKQFVMFLANDARFILSGLKVACAPYYPGQVVTGWAFWKGPSNGDGLQGDEERDQISLALQQVDFERVEFVGGRAGGTNGEDRLNYLRKMGRPIFGSTVCAGLLEDLRLCQNKADSVLEKIYDHTQLTYIDFPGDVIRTEEADRMITFLRRDAPGVWSVHCRTLKGVFRSDHVSAVSKFKIP